MSNKLSIWFMAIRPKTLPAAISPVVVGTAFATRNDVFSLLPFIAALIGALLIQILSNLANDYYDYIKGHDTKDRKGPTRVVASGLMSLRELRNGILINILVIAIIGIYLIYIGTLFILIIGILSIIFALLYSGGPFPLSSIGLGDLFVFIFFGLIAVNGTYYVQALSFHPNVLIGSIAPGLLITAILVVNNYRDIETDTETNKFTLAVLIGHTRTKYYYALLFIISYLIPFYFVIFEQYSLWVLLPYLSIPYAIKLVRSVWESNDGPVMNEVLAGTGKIGLLFSLLFGLGIIL